MAPNDQLIFVSHPDGLPVPGKDTKKITEELDVDGVALNGGVLVKNLALSLDPYMRGRMTKARGKNYHSEFPLGKVIGTLGLGRVLRSEHADYKVGEIIYGQSDLATYAILSPARLDNFRKIDNKHNIPWTNFTSTAGMPGRTAYWSFYNIGKPVKGETIFITGASGAVGQVVGQLAKREGLKVIGSAGSDEKAAWLKKELGFDVAFNYKKEDTLKFLEADPPNIYFDNVGGEVLDMVLTTIKNKGRIIACGAISQYNKQPEDWYGVKNTIQIIGKELVFAGFVASLEKDYTDFNTNVPKWIASGELKVNEHITKGIDNGESFVDMLVGKSFGKAVITLDD